MDKYKCLRKLGEGSSGTVWQALDRDTGELVAIKAIKRSCGSWEDCMQLPEFKCQRKLLSHRNVLKLQEVHRESKQLFFVFDYMEKGSLYTALWQRQERLSEDQIRSWFFQLLSGLQHIHQGRFFHLDIKPENLLLSSDNELKIADFGLAQEMQWTTSKQQPLGYIATRWYRAPELLLRSAAGPASDIWAAGIILTELYNMQPIFRGTSEADQVSRMCDVLGEPTPATWPEGVELLKNHRESIGSSCSSTMQPPPFRNAVPGASLDAIDLIRWMLSWDPRKRPSAGQALDHPFFHKLNMTKNRPRRSAASASACRRLTEPSPRVCQRAVAC